MSVQNQNTNLSIEARINFGKLPETPAKAILLQNLHISGQIERLAEYEMIITNSALRASLVQFIISYSARPRRIIVQYDSRVSKGTLKQRNSPNPLCLLYISVDL